MDITALSDEQILDMLEVSSAIDKIQCDFHVFERLEGGWACELTDKDSMGLRQVFTGLTKGEAIKKAAEKGQWGVWEWA